MEFGTPKMHSHDARQADVECLPEHLRSENAIATLSHANGDFIRAIRKKKSTRLQLVYTENGKHFRAKGKFDIERIKNDFLDYFARGTAWKSGHEWKHLHMPRWINLVIPASNILAALSAILFVLNICFWVRSYVKHDMIRIPSSSPPGYTEYLSADGDITRGTYVPLVMSGRGKVMSWSTTYFFHDSGYSYMSGLATFGTIPFLKLVYWAALFEIKRNRSKACRHCGYFVTVPSKICPHCGEPYVPLKCQNCGYDLRASTGRCPECGTEPWVEPVEPQAVPVVQQMKFVGEHLEHIDPPVDVADASEPLLPKVQIQGTPDQWLAWLVGRNRKKRRQAKFILAALTPAENVSLGPLIDGLSSDKSEIVFWSAVGLSGLGPAAIWALPKLIQLADHHPKPEIRQAATMAVRHVSPHSVNTKELAARKLADKSPLVRQEALRTMISIGELSAAELYRINSMAQDPDKTGARWSEIAMRSIRRRSETSSKSPTT